MQISPIPTLSEEINDIRLRTADIVANRIIPNEGIIYAGGDKSKKLRKEINEEVKPGSGTHSYTTQHPINTLVDICLGKEYKNHGDITINLKMVRTLDAAYRSMKSLKLEDA